MSVGCLQRGESLRTSEMASDMIPFRAGCSTVSPFASQTKVVGALPTNVLIAEMIIELLRVGENPWAVYPETDAGETWRPRRLWGRV